MTIEERLKEIEEKLDFLKTVLNAVCSKTNVAVVKNVLSNKPDEVLIVRVARENDYKKGD